MSVTLTEKLKIAVEQAVQDIDKWIASLKPGDEVAVRVEYGRRWIIKQVDRVTPAQIIAVGGVRYMKKNGREIGNDTWDTRHIEPVTETVREAVAKEQHVNQIRRFADQFRHLTDSLPLSALESIHEHLKTADEVWGVAKDGK